MPPVYADFPDSVEMMHNRALGDLEQFLKLRRGYYSTIWIARTHNLDLAKPILERGGVDVLGGVRVVLDTEAIAATREAQRHWLAARPNHSTWNRQYRRIEEAYSASASWR